jgi:hypothetical protein
VLTGERLHNVVEKAIEVKLRLKRIELVPWPWRRGLRELALKQIQ